MAASMKQFSQISRSIQVFFRELSGAPESKVVPRLGVALGGGFARGMVHIGVLKVLEEAQIPIAAISHQFGLHHRRWLLQRPLQQRETGGHRAAQLRFQRRSPPDAGPWRFLFE